MGKKRDTAKVFPARPGRSLWQLVLFVVFTALLVGSASAQLSYDTIRGNLADGTPWAMVAPSPIKAWNGTIILDLDGSSVGWPPPPSPTNPNPQVVLSATVKWLLAHGYAYGGTNRSPVGYDFPKAVENLLLVRQQFMNQYNAAPFRTIAWGGSRGGFVGRKAMELHPEIFNAAIVMGGGGGGEIAVLNAKLDSLFVLKTLVDPSSPLKIVGVPNDPAATSAENNALIALVNNANGDAAGQARLALAAAVEQFSPWTVAGTKEPGADDWDAQYKQLVTPLGPLGPNYVFANPIVVRAPIEQMYGGVVSWNHGVNYTAMLARSGRADFVKAMYEKAGLDLQADLKKLEQAPRIAAEAAAVARAEEATTYTGKIQGPVINVDNIGDPVDPSPMKIAYEQTIRRAGNEKLFRLTWVYGAGHMGQTELDRITAFVTLVDRLDTGKWGDTSAKAMNALAARIASESPDLKLGDPTFIEYHTENLLRPWDVSDWGSYKPSEGCQPGLAVESCR